MLWVLLLAAGVYVSCCLVLAALRWFDPPLTPVHAQRRIEAWFGSGKYTKRYSPVPLSRISVHLQHAVVAAEDARFYEHHGIDWKQVGKVIEQDLLEDGHFSRGASTITQQLIKNLFATTHRSWPRKAAEFALVPAVEILLPKKRILELYLNVIEWGPGVYGAEAAAHYYYGVSASALGREQSARLAACLPSPRRRRPERMDRYAAAILVRMQQMGF